MKRHWLIFFALLCSSFGAAAQSPSSSGAGQNGSKTSTPTLTPSSFGFQCGTGKATNCPNETWPSTIAQPGMIRLWDSQVQWHALNPGRGSYKWKTLDGYLDAIAAHQPRDAMYTFGYTPCWDTKDPCERPAWGSNHAPGDLTSSGSPSFTAFVTALVGHCSAARHCVKDYIKYWEMWNEANAPQFWAGSTEELYSLMSPAIAIIRNKVPGALVLTPPANGGDTDWMQGWLNEENRKGRLSDIFSIHLYLQNGLPEKRFNKIKDMVDLKNSTSGWSNTPWMDTETNFHAATFSCDSKYTSDDCVGQMVRWHLLQYAYGAQQISWFFFNTTIGRNPDYSNAYHSMMALLVGGYFTGECSSNGDLYTCPFVQSNGRKAMFVWNVSGNKSYTPPSEYADFKDLSGGTTEITPGRSVSVGLKPIMLEAPH